LSKVLDKIRGKLGDAKEALVEKKDQYKLLWEATKPTRNAKHIPVMIKRIRIKDPDGSIIHKQGVCKGKMIKYRNKVGLYLSLGSLPAGFELARKTGDLRALKLFNKSVDFRKDYPVNYTVVFPFKNGGFFFSNCTANLLFYKGELIEVELPFSNEGEYVEDNTLKQDVKYN